jgi:hypothetical protein
MPSAEACITLPLESVSVEHSKVTCMEDDEAGKSITKSADWPENTPGTDEAGIRMVEYVAEPVNPSPSVALTMLV